jgi:WD40 repeat protein
MVVHPDLELLQAYLDGTLDPTCQMGVDERLKHEPDLADEFVRLAREDGIYTEWVRSSTVADSIGASLSGKRRPRRWAPIVVGATICASLALLAFLLTRPDRNNLNPNELALATLEDIEGAVDVVTRDGNVRAAQTGQPLYAGQEVHTGDDGSSTVIRVQDTRLVLAPETRIRFGREAPVSDAGWPFVFVDEGMVAAEVSQRNAKPMVLHSKHAELRGLTGHFSFVSLPESTVIEADDGAGQVTRKSDGKKIEVRRGQSATTAADEPFRAKDLTARLTNPKRTFADNGPVLGLLFDPEGLGLMSSAGDAIKRWDLNSGKATPLVRTQKKKPIKLVALAPNCDLAAIAHNDDRVVKVFKLADGAERPSHKGLKRVVALALSQDSAHLAVSWTAGKDGNEVRVYDTALGVEHILHTGHNGAVQSLAFSPKGGLLATAADRSVKVWDALSGTLIRAVAKLPNEPRCLAFSPDDHWLAFGDKKGTIRVIDVRTGSEKAILTGHLRDISSLSFSPDGQTLLSGAADGTAKLWHLADGREITTMKAHGNAISSVAYSQDGRTIATGSWDRKIMLWDVPTVPIE